MLVDEYLRRLRGLTKAKKLEILAEIRRMILRE